MKMCEQGFCFTGDVPDSVSKDMHTKRQTLLELVDYVNQAQQVSEVFTDNIQQCVVRMVSANIFRSLPAMEHGYDAEQDEPTYEASWPHLQVVYEFLLRFVISSQVSSKHAKKHINHAFCSSLVELFDSEDPRERDYLKTILHRIYGKFMAHRAFIRRTIRDTFFSFVYETDRFNGIGELLEILGSIINGFALPLKNEHVHFLHKALIPLHKPKCIGLYHQQLVYCITQYMEKDKSMCEPIVRGLISYWPWTSTNKVVLFIHELEEILELAHPGVLDTLGEECLRLIMQTVSRCISSPHFQIAERMLFLWNNQYLTSSDALFGTSYTRNVLPLVIGALVKNLSQQDMGGQHEEGGDVGGHWNPTVKQLTDSVIKMYQKGDAKLYDTILAEYNMAEKERERKRKKSEKAWAALDQKQD
jgi:serine/threonine-protein phosphatase 2A regulatory subunit B'